MTDLQKEKIVAMREQKATYAAISETIGIPIGTIKAFCHRNSLTTETPKGKPFFISTVSQLPQFSAPCQRQPPYR